MSLLDLVDNTRTDKNTSHSYLELYNSLLTHKKNTAKYVLEVGIGDFEEKNGGSIKLWRDYFTNATVYGLDILPQSRVMDNLLNDDRIVLYTSTDAYNTAVFNELILAKNIKFDFLLDDGPHTRESMTQFIQLYTQVMADDGILIVEDIPSIERAESLVKDVPEHLQKYVKVYDLRANKDRFDDIVLVINKSTDVYP